MCGILDHWIRPAAASIQCAILIDNLSRFTHVKPAACVTVCVCLFCSFL